MPRNDENSENPTIGSRIVQKLLSIPDRRRRRRDSLAKAIRNAFSSEFKEVEIFITALKRHSRDRQEWILLAGKRSRIEEYDPQCHKNRPSFIVRVIDDTPLSAQLEVFFDPIAIIVRCSSAWERKIVVEILDLVGPLILILFSHCNEIDKLQESIRLSRVAATFPRGSDDILAYHLLEYAKLATPSWTSVAFWRTSRTQETLERIAAHTVPKTAILEPAQIDDWGLPRVLPICAFDIPSKEVLPFPELTCVFGPEINPSNSSSQAFARAISSYPDFELSQTAKRQITTTSGETQCVNILYPRAKLSTHLSRDSSDTVFLQKLTRLLERLQLRRNSVTIILAGNIFRPMQANKGIDLDTMLPGPFQVLLTLVFDYEENFAPLPFISQLIKTYETMSRTKDAFELLSRSRMHLRFLTNFLIRVSDTRSLEEISRELEIATGQLYETPHFLFVDIETNRILLTSSLLVRFNGQKVYLPQVRQAQVLSITNLSDIDNTLLADIQQVIVQDNEARRNALLRSLAPQQDARELLESYRQTGAAIVPCSDGRALIVVGTKRWKLRALEEMSLRILSTGVHSAVSRLQPGRAMKSSSFPLLDNTRILLNSSEDVATYLQRVISLIEHWSPEAEVLIVSVDREGRFWTRLATTRYTQFTKKFSMSLLNDSLISECWHTRHVVHARIDNEKTALRFDNRSVPFYSLITVTDTVTAFPLGHTETSNPIAVLVIAPKWRDESVDSAIESIAETASIWLERKRGTLAREISELVGKHLLDVPGASDSICPVLTMSQARESHSGLPRLPPSLCRAFSGAFRLNLNTLLSRLCERTGVGSITIRIRDTRDEARGKFLWLMAQAERSSAESQLLYDCAQNVHSYCCKRDPKPQSVLIPDISDHEFLHSMYPGISHLRKRSQTTSELCLPLMATDFPMLSATFNIECECFEPLWLHEETFFFAASAISRNLFARELLALASEQYLQTLVRDYTVIANHRLHKSAEALYCSIRESIELRSSRKDTLAADEQLDANLLALAESHRSIIQFESERSQGLAHITASNIANLLEGVVTALNRDWPFAKVELTTHDVSYEMQFDEMLLPRALPELLSRLILEQGSTLSNIAVEQNRDLRLKIGARSVENQLVIDVLNSADVDSETRDITEHLFWQEIDIVERQGKGESGLGLLVLGSLLRSINVIPVAHRKPDSTCRSIYGNDFAGIWIELRVVSSERTHAAD